MENDSGPFGRGQMLRLQTILKNLQKQKLVAKLPIELLEQLLPLLMRQVNLVYHTVCMFLDIHVLIILGECWNEH